MAYYTGTASSFADLQTAIENAATANGWSLSNGILSDGTAYVRFYELTVTGLLRFCIQGGTGQTGATLDEPSEYAHLGHASTLTIQFPVTYHIHAFQNPNEVYCIVNHSVIYYDLLAFGRSDIPGIGGTGGWVHGPLARGIGLTGAGGRNFYMRLNTRPPISGTSSSVAGRVLWNYYRTSFTQQADKSSTFIHCETRGATEWKFGFDITSESPNIAGGLGTIIGLLQALPNQLNSAHVLLPARCVLLDDDAGLKILCQNQNLRFTRNDLIQDGEVITYGLEKWKVYPCFSRDLVDRSINTSTVTTALHSGTLAYAIRYDGP